MPAPHFHLPDPSSVEAVVPSEVGVWLGKANPVPASSTSFLISRKVGVAGLFRDPWRGDDPLRGQESEKPCVYSCRCEWGPGYTASLHSVGTRIAVQEHFLNILRTDEAY